ncbi:MAG: ATP-dependent Clp protease ATP-binding subunit [Paludibacteraceae bacterium]|nr:ATP-dependent Clp protease ATP-binding subunit [Paludibacteraceae bacterium]
MKELITNIATSYAVENCSHEIAPAHLFKAILHKEAGLVSFIETELDKDYFYMQEWVDVQMSLAPKAARPGSTLHLSEESQAVYNQAEEYRLRFGLAETNAVCLLASLVTPGVGFTFEQLKTLPLSATEICDAMHVTTAATGVQNNSNANAPYSAKTGNAIQKYCIDKTQLAANGQLGIVIGFEEEMAVMYQVLGRKTKSNLLITGESGVGKTALINGFVLQLQAGTVPAFLQGAKAFELDLTALAAQASYKGEIDDRFKKLLAELNTQKNAVLIIESIDKLFDKQGMMYGAATMLKQALSQGTLLLLATASVDGYTKNIETDKELLNKFEKITIEEPNAQLCEKIITGALAPYQTFHGLTAGQEVVTEAIRLAKRYLTERALPDSAFDLIDRTMAWVKIQNQNTQVEPAHLFEVVAKKTGIPLGKVQGSERNRLINAEDTLKQRVVGQDHAVKTVLDAIFESRSGLTKKGQPMGSFFFLGPTGTGKTELSKALASFLFQDESSLIRFDMSEFKEEHSVALLYGAPPGYVGYEEGGLLVNKIRQKPYSVVLFDEIEKAHKSVFDLFLQILDEGKLHDRLGRVGDFSNALILFTSNIGSEFIAKAFAAGKMPQNNQLMDIMQGHFRPEFLGRLTEIVPFSPITEQTVTRIFDIHLKGLLNLLVEQNITLQMTDEVKRTIAMKGYNPQYGARPILGIIRKELRNPLSKLIISGEIKAGDTVQVSIQDDNTVFKTTDK